MRNRLSKIIGSMSFAAALLGCGGGSGSGTGTGGSSAGGHGGSGMGGSNLAGRSGTGTGGLGTGAGGLGAGGAGGGNPVTGDCLPACIANLRAGCERPVVDAGSCTSQADAGGVYCYSNGVRETQGPADGGLGIATFTKPDGHTLCYQVFVDLQGVEHFQSPTGQDVAQLTSNTAAGTVTVTCDGMTQTVSLDTCMMLDVGACHPGACP